MSYLHAIELELQQIRDANRYREISDGAPAGIDFSSNDYLGLASEPQVVEALRRATRAGSAGARLLGGAHREHRLLEEELAVWLGRERVLLFSSGYHAALGAIPVLARAVGGSIASTNSTTRPSSTACVSRSRRGSSTRTRISSAERSPVPRCS